MKKTFVADETMRITIPIGSVRDNPGGQLMPDKFQCMFKDSYKVFVINGKPLPLGAAQAIIGVFIVCVGLISTEQGSSPDLIHTLPSALFVIAGMCSYAAGQSPNIDAAKLSFFLNIVSFLWSIAAVSFCANSISEEKQSKLKQGILGLIMILLVVETCITLFLIYWLSRAICRQQFNSLPIILLKYGD